MIKQTVIYENYYFGIYEKYGELTMGISDGVGYLGSLDNEEIKHLYESLKEYYESREEK